MLAVHFGGGNIGRGFIGALLDQSGYETIFVDVNDNLIDALNQEKSYRVILAGGNKTLKVENVSGLNSKQQEGEIIQSIENADLVTTAVGPHILPMVAPLIAKGLEKRIDSEKGLINVIACENMIGGSSVLRDHVYKNLSIEKKSDFDRSVGFPDAAVDRIVPDQNHEDPLTVEVEPFYEWVVETPGIKGDKPEVEGITYVEDLTPFIERKLFTVNTGHAAAAYLGRQYGHSTIKGAMEDETVLEKVRGTLAETGAVLMKKYDFNPEDHQSYTNKIIDRFMNPSISDEVTRVGRGPKRKLGPKDRLIRPAVEYAEWIGEEPTYLAEVIAAALQFNNPNDEESREIQQSIQEIGAIDTLKKISELPEGHAILKLVEKQLI
ncbi:mannitol-1-phosphate 5-dehydrogenase [Halobacillus sp. A1]|uniref:mannitol-1-phosphate 5-dehydrogenase n=1 Tax=Halobacillus sp. A1 TaxID=2880262 RepID=UPI0020A684DB|nr:mannitol-1-phosphate 5-dehydrogenase [Halobacillus sp. A1]MCP3032075.1 mannitol-1-phosphate 5-dehydrogenase [Halobacillus sp. A1]